MNKLYITRVGWVGVSPEHVRVYQRELERFLDDYCLTMTHVMTLVGRPDMCGVPV